MDVRIGVTNTPKEITIEMADDVDVDGLMAEVEQAVAAEGVVLWLTDVRGRRVGVPDDRIAYVDLGAAGGTNPVGFG